MFQIILYFKERVRVCRELFSKTIFLLLSFVLLLCLSLTNIYPANHYLQEATAELSRARAGPQEIIRFHVKAHSDRPEDQEIKNELAGILMSEYGPSWRGCSNSSELSFLLVESINDLEKAAQDYLHDKGVPYQVRISMEKRFFPARIYANEVYPAGEYETLYVMVGDGAGENWWCVLFPPLCFNILPAGREGQENNETYTVAGEVLINKQQEDQLSSRKWRFWLVELFRKK